MNSTNDAPRLGAILFLEDLRHRGLGQIDRNLIQLLRTGTLDGIAGIALGHFDGFDDHPIRAGHCSMSCTTVWDRWTVPSINWGVEIPSTRAPHWPG